MVSRVYPSGDGFKIMQLESMLDSVLAALAMLATRLSKAQEMNAHLESQVETLCDGMTGLEERVDALAQALHGALRGDL